MSPDADNHTDSEKGRAAYITVTLVYWVFMLTDGALRMLVLLHFHVLGFSPLDLAYLFLLYEVAGILTNLSAGWIAARFGLTSTLFGGLVLQIAALLALTQLDPSWGIGLSVLFVMAVQGAAGVAKDLTKMSAKSSVKLLAPDNQSGLFRWVAYLTGSKNAIKGIGFFVGTWLLASWGFNASLFAMAVLLAIVLLLSAFRMPKGLAAGRKDAKFTEVISTNPNINWLSAARVFLFGARDVWFVVGIPIYFYTQLDENGIATGSTAFLIIGSFMALWVILYGAAQTQAPTLLKAKQRSARELVAAASPWAFSLGAIPLILAALVYTRPIDPLGLAIILVIGLLIFGFLFAINSSLHSFLILHFTSGGRVTLDVGFYYMANAAGRLLGTLLSGLTIQFGGLTLCLATAALMLALSGIAARRLSALQATEA